MTIPQVNTLKELPTTIMVSIDTLVKIYNNFGDREKLSPLGSADEEIMWNDKLTPKQVNWLERFIMWFGIMQLILMFN